ncbi:MAG: MG2 domain-containing protein, partial [Ignavibacteria bacterium]|nr:MG2 domain-containing protein [Ignavibacteria bacterium]
MSLSFSSLRIFYLISAFILLSKAEIISQDISFQVYTNSIYSPGETVNLYVYSYNTKKNNEFTFTVYRINDIGGFFSRQVQNYSIDVLGKDSLNLLYFCDEIHSFKKKLSVHGDKYFTYSEETFQYTPRSKGAYLVKLSCENKVAYTGFFVTELGIITNVTSSEVLIYTVNRKTGEPVNDVKLGFFLGQRNIGTGITQNGLFYKSLTEDDRNYVLENNIGNPVVIAEYGEDAGVSDPGLYFGFSPQKYNVYIYPAQPVYRPGMKVGFRGTVREIINSQYKNFPDRELTVKIRDSRGSEIYKQVLKTNFNGTFTGDYELSSEAPLGQYFIIAELDERNSYSGSFFVEEYKKPEYKVNISSDRKQYGNGEVIKATVQADYYFGSPVQDADIEYLIFKKEYYRPWWYFSDYRSWYEEYYSNLDENYKYSGADLIYTGKGKLNSEGKFDFEYVTNEDFRGKRIYWWMAYESESDFTYIIQAKVRDKSRREISSTTTVLVTRADFILTSKTDKYLYKPGEEVIIEVNAMDFSDKPVETEFEAEVYRITWSAYPDYKENRESVTKLDGRTEPDGRGSVKFKAEKEGYYSITINSRDSRGRRVTDKTYCYVSGGNMSWWYNESGAVQIITDKDSYKPGEICRAVIITTKAGSDVLITTQNDKLISYRVEKFNDVSEVIEIPVDENCTPNFYITASYVTDGKFYTSSKSVMVIPETKFLNVNIGSDKTIYKPGESASLIVKVTDHQGNPVKNSELSLGVIDESIYAIKSDNTKEPAKFFYSPKWYGAGMFYNENRSYYGYSRLITIYERFNLKSLSEADLGTVKGRVIDYSGNGVPSVNIVIDDDYLAGLSDQDGNFEFKLPEGNYKISVLQGKGDKDVSKRIYVKKGFTNEVRIVITTHAGIIRDGWMDEGREMMESDLPSARLDSEVKNKAPGENVFLEAETRSDFRDAAYWTPSVRTDDNGYAYISVKFPDNLTEWRITSRVITEDTRVGQGVKSLITRKDLLVRLETPRFLQQGDEVTFSTIVHNYLAGDKLTRISLNAENILIKEKSQKEIIIPANGEVRIDWKAAVTEPVGFAKITAKALTNEESDAVELKVPLQPHGLQLAMYNTVDISETDRTETKNLQIPQYTDLRSVSLTLTAAPSLASAILGALDGLVGYPYGCVEQTMSRFLPTVVVAAALKELNAPISDATKKDLPKMVEAGYNRLYSMQHYDGGWGWWMNDNSQPFMTAYVIYGLTLADKSGYPVRKDVYGKGINALKNQLKDKSIDPQTRAYMLYSLSHAEGVEKKLFDEQFELISLDETLNDYTLALLSMTFSNIGDREKALMLSGKLLRNVKYQGEAGAYWGGDNVSYRWQDDKVQVTSMAIKALIAQPISLKDNPDLINKAVRWLMMQRQGGGWTNTKSTAFAIYTLVDYLKTSDELDPDFMVRIFVNDEQVEEKRFTKADVFERDLRITIEGSKLREGSNILRVEKNGRGKLYLTSDLRYYTSETKIQPRENGFRVEKEYYVLEKYRKYERDEMIYRKRYFDGKVKSGQELLVKIRVSAKDFNSQYFMLEDPIPAGCEVVKDDWAYRIEDEKDYQGWSYYWWRWW